MNNILLLAKRELRSFVDTPVGYVVLAVFPATLAALFFLVGSFFVEGEATLRNFFNGMPMAMALLVPALTMRMWSEEIREGTEELLLTWPIRLRALVLGKFLGALSLLALTLLATIMIPLTVAYLGDVDGGAVLAGYCGTFLLGAVCASLGLLLSSLTRNQIVAWLSSSAILVALNLLSIAATARSIPPTLAHALQTMDLGVHFYSMSRGVIDAADLLFFLALTLFFLVCNGLVLEWRLRQFRCAETENYARPITTAWTVSLLLGCLFSFLALVDTLTWRIDLTEDQRYTISPATLSLLGQLEDRLQVKLYFNEDIEGAEHLMPARKDLVNLLEEVARYSEGRMVLETVDPTVDLVAARDAEHVGIVPITVTDREVGGVSMESLYQGLEMRYQDRSEVIPFLVPGEFEFAFSVRLAALLRENRPVLGFFSREPALTPPMPGIPQQASPDRIFERLREQLGSRYAIRDYRTASADAPFDRDLSALVVARPEEVTQEEQAQLTAYLQDGGNVLVFIDHEVIDPSQGFTVTPLNTGMEEWLSQWGLKVHPHWVYDQQAQVLPVGEQFVTLPDGRRARNVITMPYGLFPMLTGDALSRGHVVTSELDRVAMMWAHPISYKQTVPGLSAENLLRSSEKSWALSPDVNVSMSRSNLELLQAMAATKGPPSRFALGTVLSGSFSDGAKPGVLVVLGDADLFHNRSLPQGSENAIFGVNLLDWLSQDDALISLRTRGRRSRDILDFYQESIQAQGGLAGTDVENRVIDRQAQKARISAHRTLAWSNVFFPPLLILLAALGHFAVRRSRSKIPFVQGVSS